MADVDNLRSRIQMMLSSRRTKLAEKQQEVEDSMQALGRRQDHFVEVAAKIFESIVEPRLKLLEEQLKDASYQRSSETRGIVTLNRERRYAATASLEMEIQCDQETRNLLVNYHLRIIPVLMEYRGQDSLVLPLEAVDDTRVASFVEEKLVECVQSYLRLQDIPAYRKSTSMRDPVCGTQATEPSRWCMKGRRTSFARKSVGAASSSSPPVMTQSNLKELRRGEAESHGP